MSCWAQLPAATAAPDQDFFNKIIPCSPAYKCWEATGPFEGGSVPWRGGVSKADAEQAQLRPQCTWGRCPCATCPQHSYSGSYDLKKYRPPCSEIVKPEKKQKQQWCWEPEGSLLQFCTVCKPSAYECPPDEQPDERCPTQPVRNVPLFLWPHGYTISNTAHVPTASYMEGLEWKNPPPAEDAVKKDVALWSVGCMSSLQGPPADAAEETAERTGARARRCPGRCKGTVPLFLWSDGYGKENRTGLPYPGRGLRPFDFCEFVYGRPSYPSKKEIQRQRERRWMCSDFCCRNAFRQPAWCSAVSDTSHITPS